MTELLIIIGLILLNGVFSMTEMAMVSVRKSKLDSQAERGSKKAKRTLELLNQPNKFLSTIQIGITLIGILTGIFSGETIEHELIAFFQQFPALQSIAGALSKTVIVIIVTYFALVFGELFPKRIALNNSEVIAKTMTPVMKFLNKMVYPFVWLLSFSTQMLVKIFKVENKKEDFVTEEEIRVLINESAEKGEIESVEQEIIERVFHLNDRAITSIMTHYSDLHWLNTNMTLEEARAFSQKHSHSYYPLCEGDIDNLKGIIAFRELYKTQEVNSLEEIMHPTFFVTEENTIFQVMEMFKKQGIHTSFVVDEYGTVEGMVTRRDIFYAIVGDMSEEEEDSEKQIILRSDGTYWIDGQIHFYDFLDYFDYTTHWNSETEDFDTLAGFALSRLGHIPEEGERFVWKKFTFEIADMDKQRIDKILVFVA